MGTANVSAQKKKTPRKKAAPAKIDMVKTAPEELLLVTKVEEAFKPGAPDPDGWSLYESKVDLFKLAFPPTPVVTDELDPSGKKDGNRYYSPEPVTAAKLSLMLTVSPAGFDGSDENFKRKVYDAWMSGLMAGDGSGRNIVKASEKEFVFGNSFGREVVIDRGDFRFHGWLICPADKCYYLSAGSATPGAAGPLEYAEIEKWKKKFFDSFQILKAAPVSQ
jgi:hypothetical protein